ncbi:hypothetical protein AB0L04_08940 [Streptomyces glaucescens]
MSVPGSPTRSAPRVRTDGQLDAFGSATSARNGADRGVRAAG